MTLVATALIILAGAVGGWALILTRRLPPAEPPDDGW